MTTATAITARPIPIQWHAGLSIYASEKFLQAVADEYGWLGGFDPDGQLRCVLPYTIIRKAIFRLVRFRIETIAWGGELQLEEEKAFLNSVIQYFRCIGSDLIIPASTNAIFRTYPDGAIAAPYGTYIIDLGQDEEAIFSKFSRTYRNNIRKAVKIGVTIESGLKHVDTAYDLTRDTFKRSSLPFMSRDAYHRIVHGLGEHGKLLVAFQNGVAQSCTFFPFSDVCGYALYGGNLPDRAAGAFKLIMWEGMRQFRALGVKRFDFVGARLNPTEGTKAEGLVNFREHFGAELVAGYMWKYSFNWMKSVLYQLAVRFQRGGDIVDQEQHKLG